MIWLFDLDNTLYPWSSGLYERINKNMNDYIMDLLKIPYKDVDRLRKQFIEMYGTTLLGMMIHYQIEPQKFLSTIHSIPIKDYLCPQPILKEFLFSIPFDKYIFTNSPLFYAKKVLQTLSIESCFKDIFAIEFLQYHGKPAKEAFEAVIKAVGNQETSFVDDDMQNIKTAKLFGFHCYFMDSCKVGVKDYYQDLFIPTLKGKEE